MFVRPCILCVADGAPRGAAATSIIYRRSDALGIRGGNDTNGETALRQRPRSHGIIIGWRKHMDVRTGFNGNAIGSALAAALVLACLGTGAAQAAGDAAKGKAAFE